MDDDRRSSENNGEVESLGKDCSAPLTLSSRMLRGPSFGPARSTASHKLSPTIAIHSMLRRKTLARGEKHQPAEADIRPLDGNSRFVRFWRHVILPAWTRSAIRPRRERCRASVRGVRDFGTLWMKL